MLLCNPNSGTLHTLVCTRLLSARSLYLPQADVDASTCTVKSQKYPAIPLLPILTDAGRHFDLVEVL